MEKIYRETVPYERKRPAPDISSKGTRMPEKNICGMNMIGSQLIAILTFFDRTLMHRPSRAPETHAAIKSETIAALKVKEGKKKSKLYPKNIAWKTVPQPKTNSLDRQ